MGADLAAALKELASIVPASPAERRISIRCAAMTGDCSAGFISAQLPVASAAAVMPVRIASGKFHGAMIAAMPRGS